MSSKYRANFHKENDTIYDMITFIILTSVLISTLFVFTSRSIEDYDHGYFHYEESKRDNLRKHKAHVDSFYFK
jgi:hypothetical protein